jgi:hypothetical protein
MYNETEIVLKDAKAKSDFLRMQLKRYLKSKTKMFQ